MNRALISLLGEARGSIYLGLSLWPDKWKTLGRARGPQRELVHTAYLSDHSHCVETG